MTVDSKIIERLTKFQADLVRLSISELVRRHITFGDCYILSEDSYYALKAEVADHFSLHPSEVIVVGSAKQGFSIAPNKRYQHFGDTSDIDVTIVSQTLFDRIWDEVWWFNHQGGYWPKLPDFREYLFRGWMRPDKLPPSDRFEIANEWWEFFRELTRSERYGPYKIRGALYRSWVRMEAYQSGAVDLCVKAL